MGNITWVYYFSLADFNLHESLWGEVRESDREELPDLLLELLPEENEFDSFESSIHLIDQIKLFIDDLPQTLKPAFEHYLDSKGIHKQKLTNLPHGLQFLLHPNITLFDAFALNRANQKIMSRMLNSKLVDELDVMLWQKIFQTIEKAENGFVIFIRFH